MTSASQSGAVANLVVALARMDGDRRLLADLITIFGEDSPGLVQDILTGLETGDAGQVRLASHSLKGLAANFEACTVVQLAAEIERLAGLHELQVAAEMFASLQMEIAKLELALADYLQQA